jgi:hypothetical protein
MVSIAIERNVRLAARHVCAIGHGPATVQIDALPSAGVADHVLTPIEIAGLVD